MTMDEDIVPRLQALQASGDFAGYLCSRLPDAGLQTGWVERGLTAKGLKGTLKTKSNQERYIVPSDQAVRLMSDRAIDTPRRSGLLITGDQGLVEDRLVVFLGDLKDSPSGGKQVVTFWSKGYSPHDLVRFVIKHGLRESISAEFHEPNIDYVEQLRADFLDKMVLEGICLKIPKGKFNPATWIKESVKGLSDSSGKVLFHSDKLKQIPAFALLFSRWLLDMDMYQSLKKGLSSLLLVREDALEVAIWDSPRGLATFAIFVKTPLEEVARKYLLPAWLAKGERIEPPTKTREVVVSSPKTDEPSVKVAKKGVETPAPVHVQESEMIDILEQVESLENRLEDVRLEDLLRRLESVEIRARKLVEVFSELRRIEGRQESERPDDKASLGLVQKSLHEIVGRLESLGSKLEDIERRASKIIE
ncbi:MAG: hypothetical protein JSW05_03085 [Candidatus Thorarchaeota archaeon]|nr:MAG: hypothetical protein JSW05_03085 [Candidatus Thorarchaeota archaeon]